MKLMSIPMLKQKIIGGIMAIDFEVDAQAVCVGFHQRIGLNLVTWWMGEENPAIGFCP